MDALQLTKIMLTTYAEFGVKIVNVDSDPDNCRLIFYITVPSSSYHKNVHGVEMSGKFLAKRVKDTMIESTGISYLQVRYSERPGQWTRNMGEAAKSYMFNELKYL